MRAVILNYGATLQKLFLPGTSAYTSDIVCGYQDPQDYRRPHPYHGAVVGPYANRIAGGELLIHGRRYQLTQNENNHHIHGGPHGLHCSLWKGDADLIDGDPAVLLSTTLSDGVDGYPGELYIEVHYRLTDDGALDIKYGAHSTLDTVINLTHHAYWNLAGHDAETLANHHLQIMADAITEVDDERIPSGILSQVADSPFDFRDGNLIMDRLSALPDELRRDHGYDCNYVLSTRHMNEPAAILSHAPSGRVMTVYTDEPGLQLYTANHLPGDDGQLAKHGRPYQKHGAICLETQHFPDSPHHPHFPSTFLAAREEFASWTRYAFEW